MKRSQHRMPMTLGRQAYPSDLTNEQCELVEPLVPAISPHAAYHVHTRRKILNAILYVLRSGCPWRMLPHEFPAWETVYCYFRRWEREGVWEQILRTLRMQMRTKQGRDPEPSAAIIDSQSIKTSAVRGPEKGYDSGKKPSGQKRRPRKGGIFRKERRVTDSRMRQAHENHSEVLSGDQALLSSRTSGVSSVSETFTSSRHVIRTNDYHLRWGDQDGSRGLPMSECGVRCSSAHLPQRAGGSACASRFSLWAGYCPPGGAPAFDRASHAG